MNLQIEVPPTLTTALDLIAANARNGEGVSRSHLIRSVLTEYVELKLGPNFRQALVAHERFGGDVLQEFVRQAINASKTQVPQVEVLADPNRSQIPDPTVYEPRPEQQDSMTDTDPGVVPPVVDAERFKEQNPLSQLPQHFPAAPAKWKGFV